MHYAIKLRNEDDEWDWLREPSSWGPTSLQLTQVVPKASRSLMGRKRAMAYLSLLRLDGWEVVLVKVKNSIGGQRPKGEPSRKTLIKEAERAMNAWCSVERAWNTTQGGVRVANDDTYEVQLLIGGKLFSVRFPGRELRALGEPSSVVKTLALLNRNIQLAINASEAN